MGRRIEKAVTENSVTTTTRYLYDNEDIIAEYDVNGNITTKYIHGLGIDEPLAMEKNGQQYYYHTDGLGSVTEITNSSGTVVQSYQYDSFGNIKSTLNPNFIQPYTFTGREYDSETGLLFYRARVLDSKTGTFTQKDPIGFAGGDVNLYRYVWNRPTGYTDPMGLDGYTCTKPLDILGGEGAKSGIDVSVNPAYHQYLCVELSTITVCGGQSKKNYSGLRELWPWGEGASSDDHFDADRCKKVSDEKCVDKCLLKAFYEKRPNYGLVLSGTNCQEWANNALAQCQKKCKEKK